MMQRKILSLLLTVMMVIGTVAVMPICANAQTTDVADTGANIDVAQTGGGLSLQGLMQKFPEGKFWNHQVKKGDSGSRFIEDSNNNPDGYTSHECVEHSQTPKEGEYKCNMFMWGIQCAGFAGKISYDVYGSVYTTWKTTDVKNCKPGDVITYKHVSAFSGIVSSHTFMVIARDGDKIMIGECNYDRHCKITWSHPSLVSTYTKDTNPICYSAPYELPSYELATPVLSSKIKNTENGMTVSWKAVDGAAKYRVYYKGGSVKSWTALGNTTKTSYGFKKAVYNTKYSFTVRAINSKGKVASDYDNKGVSATYTFAPKLTATAENGKVALSWNKIDKAVKYRVYVKGGTYTKYTKLTDTEKLTYSFTKGVSGTTYRFSIRCLDSKNQFNSDASSAVSAAFTKTLDTPKNLKAAATTTQGAVKITWDAVKGASRYQVFYQQKGKATSWKKLAKVTANTYTHTDCENNTEYTYTVRCIESNGSYISGYNKEGVTIHYYRYPTNIKVTKQDNKGKIEVTWNKVGGAEKYAVYYKTAGVTKWEKLDTVSTNSYSFTKAKNGKTYTFTVRACDENGKTISSFNAKGVSLTYKTK